MAQLQFTMQAVAVVVKTLVVMDQLILAARLLKAAKAAVEEAGM
jgi:hypothetical protein